jgi:hypothetical protein
MYKKQPAYAGCFFTFVRGAKLPQYFSPMAAGSQSLFLRISQTRYRVTVKSTFPIIIQDGFNVSKLPGLIRKNRTAAKKRTGTATVEIRLSIPTVSFTELAISSKFVIDGNAPLHIKDGLSSRTLDVSVS